MRVSPPSQTLNDSARRCSRSRAAHRLLFAVSASLLVSAGCECLAAVPPATVTSAAGSPAPLTELSLEQLMDVPVMSQKVSSVTRSESTVGKSPAAISVITQEMIHRSGATSIPELLRMVPGVNVAKISANQWVISIRGFDNTLANKLLVQIDGRTLYSPIQAGVFWDSVDYPLEDIDRIEVIRGPGGTLWGANAVNGVINIITKSSKDTRGVLVTGGAGTEEKGFATFRFGGKLGENLHYRVYGKWFERSAGFAVRGPTIDILGNERDNLAHDDWRSGRAGFRIDWTPTSSDTVTLQGDWFSVTSGRASANAQTGLVTATDTETRGVNVLARWNHVLGKDSNWQLRGYYDRSQQIGGGVGGLAFAVDTFDLDFQQQFPLGDWNKVNYGLGYRLQKILLHGLTQGVFPNQSILARIDDGPSLFSAFVQDEIKVVPDRLYLTLGSKFEHNDFTGFEAQPSGRLLWTPTPTQSVWLAVSRAVRTPAIIEDAFDLRSPAIGIVPNRGLRSEEVVAYELGYRVQPVKRFSFDTALFYNQYQRLSVISLAPPILGTAIPLQFANGMRGEVYGVEVAATWNPTDWWQIYGAYSFLKLNLHADPNIPTLPGTTNELPEKQSPQNHFYIRSSFDIPGNVQFDVIGRYVDNLSGFVPGVQSYFTIDARLAWKANHHLEFAVVGQNLLDDHHPENGGGIPIEVERGLYGQVTVLW